MFEQSVSATLYPKKIIKATRTEMTKIAEVNLLYYEHGREKCAHLESKNHNINKDTKSIQEETKADLHFISVLKRDTGINLLEKKQKLIPTVDARKSDLK